MPIIDPDQGVSLVSLADLANNQAAFANFYAGVLSRLNLRYTTEANRTLLHPANTLGEESFLTTLFRSEINTGSAWISTYPASLYTNAYRTSNAVAINNSTVLVADTQLFSALPSAGRFQFAGVTYYTGSAAGDFKLAFSWPAGAVATWSGVGMATTGAASVGDGQFLGSITSGTAIPYGGGGVGSPVLAVTFTGSITMGGTAGNLQESYAQNTADPTDTVTRTDSRLHVWRVA